jgi:hypothetical protein
MSQRGLTATVDDVTHAYRLLLEREPDAAGLAHFQDWIRNGTVSTGEVARVILNSTEFVTRSGTIGATEDLPRPLPSASMLDCRACTQRDIESPNFRYWAQRLGLLPGDLHRKPWEWCYITQALWERGALGLGRRGLGFAVGREPLTSLYTSMGCEILATDLETASADERGWVEGNQHATGVEQLNTAGLCSPELFDANARFRTVNMLDIPPDLADFDFLWSSCALEHLGGLPQGIDFVLNAMNCLRPGGIAVHTTEFNVDSDRRTVESGNAVIYRKRDFLQLVEELRARGYAIEPFDFDTGASEADLHVDEPPYAGKVHLKLRIGGFASTSFGLIIRRNLATAPEGTSNP